MVRQTTPTHMAKKLARLLRPERPDYAYVKKVFQHTRAPDIPQTSWRFQE